jgi:tetratricopeptide (TPR) repeat protein
MGQQKEALKDLDKAIEINDQYVKALLKRGEINMKLTNYEEAVRDFERVRQIEP